jgi:3-deoxy-D-manno-octulosonic-acid transferase
MYALYNLGILLYGAGIRLAALLGNKKALAWSGGRAEWASTLQRAIEAKGGTWIWVHCASLGEFEQGRPLIESLRERHPEYRILLTFFSPSGFTIRKNYSGADHVTYLPLDTPGNAQKFVQLVQPFAAFFVKYEFWLNYLSALHTSGTPVFLVSGIFRPGQVFFKWYGGRFRNALGNFNLLFLQDTNSFDLLRNVGVPEEKMIVAGDTRFDRVGSIAASAETDPKLAAWRGGDRVIVAGSTWPEDERILLPAVADNLLPDVRLLIAPHEIDESHLNDCLSRIQATFGKDAVVRYTQLEETANIASYKVLLLDTMGQLSRAYRCATVAYVGGGFGNGIHNILEAAVWGTPVLFGPNYDRFREARELLALRGAQSIRSTEELSAALRHFLLDEHARKTAGDHCANYIRTQSGATSRMLFHLESTGDAPLFP